MIKIYITKEKLNKIYKLSVLYAFVAKTKKGEKNEKERIMQYVLKR